MTAATKIALSTEHDFDELERKAAVKNPDFRFDAHRTFSSGMPAPFVQQQALVEDLANNRLSIYSFKPGRWSEVDRIVGATRTWCQGVPDEANLNLVVHHEPKDNASDLGGNVAVAGTSAQWCEMQRAVSEMLDTDINPERPKGKRIRLWAILEADSVRAGYADKFWPGDDVLRGVAFDGYSWDRNYPNLYSMENIFARPVAWAAEKGVPFGIAETSVGSRFGDKRPGWVAEGMQWLRSEDTECRFATFWSSSDQFTLPDAALAQIGANA